MVAPLQFTKLGLLPARRLISIDPGSRCIKLLLVESFLGRTRVLSREVVDLAEEGLIHSDEIRVHVQQLIRKMGNYPISLVLPQNAALSQIVDLPPGDPEEIRHSIEEQALKLSGLGESTVLHDYRPLPPIEKHPHSFWVTLCQELEIEKQCERLGISRSAICEVTTGANAVAGAFLAGEPREQDVVLVNLGASRTELVILAFGHAVYANSFPVGSEMFTESIALGRSCSFKEAEMLKGAENLLEGAGSLEALRSSVNEWFDEVSRLVAEWRDEHHVRNGSAPLSHQMLLCGGGALQPGLVSYAAARGQLPVQLWLGDREVGDEDDGALYAVAFGGALQALGRNRQSASLLPSDLDAAWKKARFVQKIHVFNLAVLSLIALLLLAGTWHKMRTVRHKEQLLKSANAALEQAQAAERLGKQLSAKLEGLRPVLERQRQTAHTLQALAHLQWARTNRNFWLVLFADARSYFLTPAAAVSSTVPAASEGTPAATGTNVVTDITQAGATNTPAAPLLPSRRGFVVEISIAEQGEAMRRTLLETVAELNEVPLFEHVDSLPSDLRRPLAKPEVTIPDRHFALALQMAVTNWLAAAKGGEGSGGVGEPGTDGSRTFRNKNGSKGAR